MIVGMLVGVAVATSGVVALAVIDSEAVGVADVATATVVATGVRCWLTRQTRVPAARTTNAVTKMSTKNGQYWRMIIAPCGGC